jgi:phospholipid/cholesterol/gamma-HCH transport system substrate-binding protein
MSPELKVGAFFFLAMGLAMTFTVIVRPDWQASGEYAVSFPRVARLKQGDQVMYNGVKVGSVTGVEPILSADGRPAVLVRFSIDKRFKSVVQTQYKVNQGVLGGAHLDISSDSGSAITPEAVARARGVEPAALDEVIASVQAIVEENRSEIRQAITAIRSGAENLGGMAGELRAAVHENREGLKTAVTNVGEAAGSINTVVVENRSSVKTGIDNIRIMAEQIGLMVAENRDQVRAAVANLSKAGEQVGAAVEENRKAIKQTADSLAAFGPKLERIGDNLEIITSQIAKGQGTIGRLVMEDTLYTKTETVVDSAQQRLEEVKPFTSGMSEVRFYPGVWAGANASRGIYTGEAYLRIEPRPWKFYQLGISYRTAPADVYPTAEDPDKLHMDFSALFGWRFLRDDLAQRYRLTVAGGMIETEFGGYVEAPLTRDLSLTVMARGKHSDRNQYDRRYEEGKVLGRAYLTYRLWERVYLSAGADDVFERPGTWGSIRGEILDNDIRNFFVGGSILK